MSNSRRNRPVRVYVCGCGPVLADALDIDEIMAKTRELDEADHVALHSTLCSQEGQDWLAEDLAAAGDCAVVMAGCSPREHERTIRAVCQRAGINPFLLSIANIREQCAWATPDKRQATDKAVRMIRSAVARAASLAPLESLSTDCRGEVLVIGGGVAGLTAASLIADAGRDVTLVERSAALGGRTALLSSVHPSGECASCMLAPLIDETLHHPHVEVLTLAQVKRVLGYAGNFTVTIDRRARRVDPAACIGCRTCRDTCPVRVPNEADEGLGQRGAIDAAYEGALPNASFVDMQACLRSRREVCEACQSACPMGAIDLSAEDEEIERHVGAIVIATGASPEPIDEQGGRVVSAATLERMLSSAGPTHGALQTMGGETPRSIAFLHGRNGQGNVHSTTCDDLTCSVLGKLTKETIAALPDCQVLRLTLDGCASSAAEGITESISLPSTARTWIEPLEAAVRVRWECEGVVEHRDVSMVVTASQMRPSPGAEGICRSLRIEVDAEGFVEADHERLRPYRSRVMGVMVAGCAGGPVDIRGATAQAAAAVGGVLSAFLPGRKLHLEPSVARVLAEHCGGCRTCAVVCPFGAARFDVSEGSARVDELLCRGCGSCVAGCPTGAMINRHYTTHQVEAELDALGTPERPEGSSPNRR